VTFTPIGVVRSPWVELAQAPRQPSAARGVRATIELTPAPGIEDALSDLDGWDHLWVIFWFHRVTGWRPKVLPPRSRKRRGLFATRAPHRPNPIGISVVRLERVEGTTLHVMDIDMVDGTPVLDIKPYVPYADSRPLARTGWLGSTGSSVPPELQASAPPVDPDPGFEVTWSDAAHERADWLRDEHASDLVERVEAVLSLGPQPHAYRRIKRVEGDGFVLAVKEWRVRFRVEGARIVVEGIESGYRRAQLESTAPGLAVHRAFVERFGR
jgi:tRNA-Thr(GGU) m(6)t(6)A37 methyltransferase TsaA